MTNSLRPSATLLGDFWQYDLVAGGALDIATEPIIPVWDLAALIPIVEEAGGLIFRSQWRKRSLWGERIVDQPAAS